MADPHPVPDEDPEAHIGDPVPDPWDVEDAARARELGREIVETLDAYREGGGSVELGKDGDG